MPLITHLYISISHISNYVGWLNLVVFSVSIQKWLRYGVFSRVHITLSLMLHFFCLCRGHWNGLYWRVSISCLKMKKHQTSYSIPPVVLNAGYQLICSKHNAPNPTFYSSKTCIFVHFVHLCFNYFSHFAHYFSFNTYPNAIKNISN